jgi:hypothetical protein
MPISVKMIMTPLEPSVRREEFQVGAKEFSQPFLEPWRSLQGCFMQGQESHHGFPIHNSFSELSPGDSVGSLGLHPSSRNVDDQQLEAMVSLQHREPHHQLEKKFTLSRVTVVKGVLHGRIVRRAEVNN